MKIDISEHKKSAIFNFYIFSTDLRIHNLNYFYLISYLKEYSFVF